MGRFVTMVVLLIMMIGSRPDPRPDGGTCHGPRASMGLYSWNPLLEISFELSSMGIRVNPEVLTKQLELCGCPERADLIWHQMLLDGILPQTALEEVWANPAFANSCCVALTLMKSNMDGTTLPRSKSSRITVFVSRVWASLSKIPWLPAFTRATSKAVFKLSCDTGPLFHDRIHIASRFYLQRAWTFCVSRSLNPQTTRKRKIVYENNQIIIFHYNRGGILCRLPFLLRASYSPVPSSRE